MTILTPGPDHPITLTPATRRWRVLHDGHIIADTGDAIVLSEASYPPVVYFPREDAGMEYMSKTERITHCPYKGDASYYTILRDGKVEENAAWSYEDPYPAMEQIRGRLAFYPDKVEIYEVDEAVVNPKHPRSAVDEVVLHTDSGGGASQRDHWPANVQTPDRDGGVP